MSRAAALAVTLAALLTAAPAGAQTPAGTASVTAALAQLAQSKSTEVRMGAARALGASRDPRALDALVAALKDETGNVRWSAIEALGALGDKRAIPALVEYVKRPEAYRWGKRLVANALGAIGDPAATPPLLELLADEDPFVRRLAALALLTIAEPRGVARVTEFLKQAGADETLGTVRRELARTEEAVGRRGREATARHVTPTEPIPVRPHEWSGVRVGSTRAAEARERFGTPLQDSSEFMLFSGNRITAAVAADSIVLNIDSRGLVESIFVFPVWGTLDRDIRSVFGAGATMPYERFLQNTGRTAVGAGTRTGGKLHYLPANLVTESYNGLGILVIYDTAETTAVDRLVKLLIVY